MVRTVSISIDPGQSERHANVGIFEKTIVMLKDLPFDAHAAEYDAWFEKHSPVFESELAAIRGAWPKGDKIKSLEIGSATGRFAKALNITEGLDPSGAMCARAEERGVNSYIGIAEDLPYGELQFDVVLINCSSYLENTARAFSEAYRVLKYGGYLLVPIIDKSSRIGQYYESRKNDNIFYRQASFYSVEDMEARVKNAGFRNLVFSQTLFNDLDKIITVEPVEPGFGKGSYVLIKAIK